MTRRDDHDAAAAPDPDRRHAPAGADAAADEGAGDTTAGGGAMRARTWTLAANYRAPADYGIPRLPTWTVIRSDDGGLVLADPDDETACIRADDPVDVRR